MTVARGPVGRVVVVGASMAGLRAAEAVRKNGYAGEVVVVGDEDAMPYNRPPLTKEALRTPPPIESLHFRLPRAAADVTWRLGRPVVGSDLARRVVWVGDDPLDYDGLVVATGLRPRRAALPGPPGGRHVVRAYSDCVALHTALTPGARVVVLGAGFIGCEVAATARALGCEVDVVAPEAHPILRPLGELLGAEIRRRHEAHGVRFHLGRVATAAHPAAEDPGRVAAVTLSDGTELGADVVVEALGSHPNVEWLEGNDLDLSDGVLTDGHLRVGGRSDVVACGDVARFPNPLFDTVPRRVEHWGMATDSGKHAGAVLAAALDGRSAPAEPFAPMPTFWSDQHDFRVQSFGAVGLGTDVRVLEGDPADEVVVGYHRDDHLVGVVLIGLPGRAVHYRRAVAEAAATLTSA